VHVVTGASYRGPGERGTCRQPQGARTGDRPEAGRKQRQWRGQEQRFCLSPAGLRRV